MKLHLIGHGFVTRDSTGCKLGKRSTIMGANIFRHDFPDDRQPEHILGFAYIIKNNLEMTNKKTKD